MITIRRIDELVAVVVSPYSAKDDVRDCPGARWDRDKRTWTIPAWAMADAAQQLRNAGHHVVVVHITDVETQQVPQPWEALFMSLPATLRPKVYRALASALHPDVGGDLAAMQSLTAAYSKVQG